MTRPAVVRFATKRALHLIETDETGPDGMEVETLCGIRDLPVFAELASDCDHGQIQTICSSCLDRWGGIPIGRID